MDYINDKFIQTPMDAYNKFMQLLEPHVLLNTSRDGGPIIPMFENVIIWHYMFVVFFGCA